MVGAALAGLLRQLAIQFTGLVKNVPQFIQWVDSVALPYLQRWYEDLNRLLPSSVSQGIAAALDALKQSLLRWAGSLSAAVTGGAFSTAMSLPNALLGVVLTMYDARNRLTREVRDEVQRCFPDHLFGTVVPRNVRLSEAPSHGKSIIHYDIKSKGADAYLNLAKEVALRDPARMPQPR